MFEGESKDLNPLYVVKNVPYLTQTLQLIFFSSLQYTKLHCLIFL